MTKNIEFQQENKLFKVNINDDFINIRSYHTGMSTYLIEEISFEAAKYLNILKEWTAELNSSWIPVELLLMIEKYVKNQIFW